MNGAGLDPMLAAQRQGHLVAHMRLERNVGERAGRDVEPLQSAAEAMRGIRST